MRGEMREVRDGHEEVVDLRADRRELLMRALEELVDHAEFVHQFERGRMDRVAAEVAEEVGVLLEDGHVDAGAREEEAEHHAGRPAADDAAAGAIGRRGRHAGICELVEDCHALPKLRGPCDRIDFLRGRSGGRCIGMGGRVV